MEAELVPPYTRLDLVERTESTNADLRAAAAQGAPDRTVLIAREQSAGRGRRDRGWTSRAGGLYCSVLLRPGVSAQRLGTLTVVAGLALVRAVARFGVVAELKWPNDLLLGERGKLAGVLAEAVDDAVVLGIGCNVKALPADVLPGVGGLPAASLADAGVDVEVDEFAVALLSELHALETRWRAADGDLAAAGLLAEYREHCATLGKEVRVELLDTTLSGTATEVDAGGRLILDGHRTVSAGDVVHLRAGTRTARG